MSNATNNYDRHCGNCKFYTGEECPHFDHRYEGHRVDATAKRLGKSVQTIYNWHNLGKIQSIKDGGNLIFPECQIRARLSKFS